MMMMIILGKKDKAMIFPLYFWWERIESKSMIIYNKCSVNVSTYFKFLMKFENKTSLLTSSFFAVLYHFISNYFNEHLPGLLAGPSGIHVGWSINQWQIRGRKAPNFGRATSRWASCNLCPLCIALDLAV